MERDTFHILAPYYDRIMTRVRYDKWEKTLLGLSQLLTNRGLAIKYLDVACGTGTLIQKLSKHGWNSVGIDISPSMLNVATHNCPYAKFVVADMRNLPFSQNFNILSCLFDSINFILDEKEVFQALSSMKSVLLPGGFLYFDCVTEQMVKLYYHEKEWKENYKEFKTVWRSVYDENSRIATLNILIKGIGWTNVYQKIHPVELFLDAIRSAGLTLLAYGDSNNWGRIDNKTVRVDFVCAYQPDESIIEHFSSVKNKIFSE